MSLLLDHGHPQAMYYPLGMLMDEAAFVLVRENARIVTEAQLLQTAIGSILSKDSRKHFSEMVKNLNISVRAIDPDATPERLLPEGYEEKE